MLYWAYLSCLPHPLSHHTSPHTPAPPPPAPHTQYDYKAFARSHRTTPIHGANVILFDGILAFYDPAVRALFDVKIFVDADADTRLVRRIRRDIVSRGRDIQQVGGVVVVLLFLLSVFHDECFP